MRFSKGNLILILVFVGGIIMPTAILSFLGFRNIQNEIFLAQKIIGKSLIVEKSTLSKHMLIFLEITIETLSILQQQDNRNF